MLVDGAGAAASFTARIYSQQATLLFPPINRTGRGPKGTAQAGGSATLTLAASDASATNALIGRSISIVAGTGIGQTKLISGNVLATKVVTVASNWTTPPDSTSVYQVSGSGDPNIRLGDIQGSGTATGLLQVQGPPLPAGWKYATGTITHKMADGLTFVYPVRITNHQTSYTEGASSKAAAALGATGSENFDVMISWVLAGNPTVTWRGTVVTFTVPTANDQETDEGMSKVYDANALATAAVQRIDAEGVVGTDLAETAKLVATYGAGLTPPQPNLKIVHIALLRTDSNGVVLTVTWGLSDTKDQVELGGSDSVRSFVDANMDRVTTLVDTTAGTSASAIANALLSGFQAENFALKLSVKKLNPVKAAVTKEYFDPGIMVIGRSFIDPTPQLAFLDGGVVKVYVASAMDLDATRAWYLVTPSILTNWVRRFVLVRWFPAGATIPEFASLAGKTNVASFLGLAAGTCYYEGPEYACKVGATTNGPFRMGYNFTAKSLGIFSLNGWQPELAYTDGLTVGVNLASALGFSGSVPATGDFSGFLA